MISLAVFYDQDKPVSRGTGRRRRSGRHTARQSAQPARVSIVKPRCGCPPSPGWPNDSSDPAARRRADRGASFAERPRRALRRRRDAGGKLGFTRRALRGFAGSRDSAARRSRVRAVDQLPDVLGLARQPLDARRRCPLGRSSSRVRPRAARDRRRRARVAVGRQPFRRRGDGLAAAHRGSRAPPAALRARADSAFGLVAQRPASACRAAWRCAPSPSATPAARAPLPPAAGRARPARRPCGQAGAGAARAGRLGARARRRARASAARVATGSPRRLERPRRARPIALRSPASSRASASASRVRRRWASLARRRSTARSARAAAAAPGRQQRAKDATAAAHSAARRIDDALGLRTTLRCRRCDDQRAAGHRPRLRRGRMSSSRVGATSASLPFSSAIGALRPAGAVDQHDRHRVGGVRGVRLAGLGVAHHLGVAVVGGDEQGAARRARPPRRRGRGRRRPSPPP